MNKLITIIALLIVAVCLFGVDNCRSFGIGRKLGLEKRAISLPSKGKMIFKKYNQTAKNMPYEEAVSTIR